MIRRPAVVVFVALCLPHPVAAQAPSLAEAVKSTVSDRALDRHAREITSSPRPSGSPGENAATDYVAATLRAAGVPVEIHEFMAYTSNPVSAAVTVPGTDFAPDAITMSFSGATSGAEAELLDLGTLRDLPELEVGTGERLAVRAAERWAHVRGRVVMVTGQPRNVPTAALEELGAVAAIFVNPEERLNELIVTSTWGTPSLLNAQRLPRLPAAQIRRSDGEALREMLADGPVRVRVRTVVDQGWKPLRMAVARVMPVDATEDTPYVLFGGHIDGWHYGGTDEGASNAAMLELALAFHAHRDLLRRGIVVAWWPGHSNARYGGSTWFADRYFQELRRRGLAYVNIDGIGQMGAKRFSVSTSPALRRLATDVVTAATARAPGQGRPGRNSDQSFNGIGLPLMQINHSRLAEDGGYWWWHTPEDTYDKIDLGVLRTDTDLYADALAAILSDPVVPLDLSAEVDALHEALDRREADAGGELDLTAARAVTDELGRMAARLDEARRRGDVPTELDRRVYDVLRPIHRVMFVPGSDHHPDPGLYGAPLPGLEAAAVLAEESPGANRYGFAQAYLIREVNRLVEALHESREAAASLLRAMDVRW